MSRGLGDVYKRQTQHSTLPVLVVRSRKYRDIPDLTSDTIGQAYLGMTAIGKQRKIAIAFDGSDAAVQLVTWATKYALTTSDQVHLLHSASHETPEQTLVATANRQTCISVITDFQKTNETGTVDSVLLDAGGDVRDLIVDHVEAMGGALDLLILGTRGIKGPQACVARQREFLLPGIRAVSRRCCARRSRCCRGTRGVNKRISAVLATSSKSC